jgi:hypothetical protein
LQALDSQVALDVGVEGVGTGGSAAQGGVATALNVQRAGGAGGGLAVFIGAAYRDGGVVVRHLIAVGAAFAALRPSLEGQAVLAAAQGQRGTDAGVAATVGAVAGSGVLAGQQVDVAGGLQRGFLACGQGSAYGGEVAVSFALVAVGGDGEVFACGYGGAYSGGLAAWLSQE